ncbi:MAG: 3-isopropylmalate dehydratase small subunit [Ekhidna sp.]|nr:3-isopropylmalate dehydratase small subunit [Ekhidna sp.]
MNINSTAIPLPIDNVDTDQIIPAKFLKQVDKVGYGKNLFYNWRFTADGSPNEDFILNKPERKQASILVAGNNFGCGSSREHAAWAIADYGIKSIISTQFADIFKGNAYNNGILPIELHEKPVSLLMEAITQNPEVQITIDLSSQRLTCKSIALEEEFEIHPFKKQCLLDGVDETEYLINLRKEVEEYESIRSIPV